ncbi:MULTISPECIES: hypothetical protein [unclassified Acinetobacter]|uniref:hypothetical protein n=1 Tax=unclassified Acinetobacter TaxID=196816 RepID=UPI002934C927|nr:MULTISPECIES: hypothetical protein [unclassified Acinetobacter]WOE31845.1 hypothetical protein QSG84_01070 [Acinetobacter sp. SAAs470]WOE37312.1 hypothetical protein QSG86_10115 [Acinetobacter sp. SAAs474]
MTLQAQRLVLSKIATQVGLINGVMPIGHLDDGEKRLKSIQINLTQRIGMHLRADTMLKNTVAILFSTALFFTQSCHLINISLQSLKTIFNPIVHRLL